MHHYRRYFTNTGTNFKDRHGEFVETVHYTLKKHEERKEFSTKRKSGTDHHLLKSNRSITEFNAMKMASTLRKK